MDNDIFDIIGDPATLEGELDHFRENARALSSRRRHFIEHYPQRWVAVYDGDVSVDAPTLPELLRRIDEGGLPRGHVVIRYIDKHPRKMIL